MSYDLKDPILSSCWKPDGSKIYAAVDSTIKEIDVQTSQIRQIGTHQAGISKIFYN